jgi:protein TonB
VALAVEQPAARDDAATQAFEGLALAEVLDPESQPASAPRAGVMPSEGHAPTDPVPSYAAMQKGPGSLRRLLPFAAAALLGISAVLFYLANREPSAQASDVDSSGRPILFSQTVGPMPALTPLPEDTVPTPAPAAAPVPAGDEPESDETMRRRYERELADLRQELDQARKLAQAQPRVTAATPAPTAGADLPADSMMRAAVAPPETAAPAGVGPVPAEVGPASGAPTEAPTATASLPEPEPEPEPELPVSATPTRPPAEAATEPAPSEATTPLPRLVNPKLVSRPTPPYPTVALRYRREATIVVRVLVGPDGRVQEVERKGPKAGMGFDRAAEEAARASIWEAGTRAGEPTAMWAELRFEFKH